MSLLTTFLADAVAAASVAVVVNVGPELLLQVVPTTCLDLLHVPSPFFPGPWFGGSFRSRTS